MRILIADDHELFRDGLRLVLGELGQDVVVEHASSYDEALDVVARARQGGLPFNVVLLDLVMPGMPWTDGLAAMSLAAPHSAVVILSASDDRRLVLETVRRGAKGFIPKTSSSKLMLSALRLVLSGGVYLPPAVLEDSGGPAHGGDGAQAAADPMTHLDGHAPAGGPLDAAAPGEADSVPLTPRQREVLALLGQGKSNKEIARILDLSEGTVKLHVTAILKALNVNNRTGAVVAASRLGLTLAGG
ncbi:LuxR C-terminal-related transcriptional regulator [Novispirillum sp. DQ9]|uniref:LuxR C-terminal-related transcriptional regulator n=1 Tax=Novispirillum sp. DQ9 TaxID=3398612 RepID=UPI003C7BD9B1